MNKFIFFFLSVLILCVCQVTAKIRLLTFHYNKPDFLEMQCKTFKKFMKDDYELIVFNDAADPGISEEIRITCEKYGVRCVRYEQEWHKTDPLNNYIKQILVDPELIHSHIAFVRGENSIESQPSIRHAHVIQYAMTYFGYDHDDIVAIVDGDCFPIRPIYLRKWLQKRQIIGINRKIKEENLEYLWVPFIAFDINKLPNKQELQFHPDIINGYLHDTGAHTYHYLKNHPEVSVEKFQGYSSTSFSGYSLLAIRNYGFNLKEAVFIKDLPYPLCVEFHIDNCFLHFGASSFNLRGSDIKSKHVMNFLKKI